MEQAVWSGTKDLYSFCRSDVVSRRWGSIRAVDGLRVGDAKAVFGRAFMHSCCSLLALDGADHHASLGCLGRLGEVVLKVQVHENNCCQ